MSNLMWTTTELARLKTFYPVMTKERLVEEFYPRSIRQIYEMAGRLKIRKRRDWQKIAREYRPVIFRVSNRVPGIIGAREG
jgi:hypothetical protein